MTAVVFFDTLPLTFPPADSIAAVASSRERLGSVPVRTKTPPDRAPPGRGRGRALRHTDARRSGVSRGGARFGGRANQSRMPRAVSGPISGTDVSASSSAASSASIERKRRARSFAVFSPTCRIPRPKRRRARPASFELLDLGDDVRGRLLAPALERRELLRRERVERGDVLRGGPPRGAGRCARRRGPRRPSRGASRSAGCDSATCAGQHGFTHRTATSPSTRTTFSPQAGQRAGIANGFAPFGRFSRRTRVTFGMTSPRLLDGHGVAHAHVLAGEVLEVVERRALDDRAREEDGRELRDGRQDAGAARPARRCPSRRSSPPRAGTCTRAPSAGTSRSGRGASGRPRHPPSGRRRPSRTAGRGASSATSSRNARISLDVGDDGAMGVDGKRDFFEGREGVALASSARRRPPSAQPSRGRPRACGWP